MSSVDESLNKLKRVWDKIKEESEQLNKEKESSS